MSGGRCWGIWKWRKFDILGVWIAEQILLSFAGVGDGDEADDASEPEDAFFIADVAESDEVFFGCDFYRGDASFGKSAA